MTIDEALSEPDYIEDTVDAYRVLAAEVRRYRAAVEAVKAIRVRDPIAYMLRAEVLAILEPKP